MRRDRDRSRGESIGRPLERDGPHPGPTESADRGRGSIARRRAMSGRKSVRGTWTPRRLSPLLEALDRRELLAAGGLSNSLGAYVAPSQFGPKVTAPAGVVNPHASIEQFLTTILGPGLQQVQAAGNTLGNSPQAVLKQTVLNQPYVHSVLSDADVYTLFGSPALTSLLGSQQVSGTTSMDVTTVATTPTSDDHRRARWSRSASRIRRRSSRSGTRRPSSRSTLPMGSPGSSPRCRLRTSGSRAKVRRSPARS